MLTEPQRKALAIVRDRGPIMPGGFARFMWPDSPSWHRYSNVGRGATTGVGVKRAAGCFLANLQRRGWVVQKYSTTLGWSRGYMLTEEGAEALQQEGDDPP